MIVHEAIGAHVRPRFETRLPERMQKAPADPHHREKSLRLEATLRNDLLQRVASINAVPHTAVICVIAYF